MTRSAWLNDDQRPSFPQLTTDVEVDVGIIGGGITGVMSAYLLKNAGLRVALVDRGRCGDGETSHTTAHLTYVTDARLHELADRFGREAAQAAWDGGATAIDLIEHVVQAEELDCDFTRLPGYLHAAWDESSPQDRESLNRDGETAMEFGFSASLCDFVPVANRPGVRFANQGIFHPLRFLAGLTPRIDGGGSHVFEQTSIDEVTDRGTLRSGDREIRCRDVVVATHVPLPGKSGLATATWLQTRLAAYSSYVVAARLPAETVEPGLWWDTADPYVYLRVEDRDGFQTAILGGEDHKTGQKDDTGEPFRKLVERMHRIFPQAVVTDRWSGQVVETNDGLPLIGSTDDRQYIATGFAGNGMTFGTLSALIIRDAVMGQANAWSELFDPTRVRVNGGLWRYLKENVDFPRYLIQDRLTTRRTERSDDLPSGAGRIQRVEGAKAAVFRDDDGELHCVSAVCTHMGCLVRWNPAERTWDCPCHGSRFGVDGEVIAGPAEAPLDRLVPGRSTAAS